MKPDKERPERPALQSALDMAGAPARKPTDADAPTLAESLRHVPATRAQREALRLAKRNRPGRGGG